MMWWLGLGSILRLLLEIIGKIPIKFPVISPTYHYPTVIINN